MPISVLHPLTYRTRGVHSSGFYLFKFRHQYSRLKKGWRTCQSTAHKFVNLARRALFQPWLIASLKYVCVLFWCLLNLNETKKGIFCIFFTTVTSVCMWLYECVCLCVCLKGQLEVGAFYLFAFCYLKKKPNWTGVQLFMWSKGAARPAQHVAHNGLGRLASRPPRPSFCFIFLQHCQHPTGKCTSSHLGIHTWR